MATRPSSSASRLAWLATSVNIRHARSDKKAKQIRHSLLTSLAPASYEIDFRNRNWLSQAANRRISIFMVYSLWRKHWRSIQYKSIRIFFFFFFFWEASNLFEYVFSKKNISSFLYAFNSSNYLRLILSTGFSLAFQLSLKLNESFRWSLTREYMNEENWNGSSPRLFLSLRRLCTRRRKGKPEEDQYFFLSRILYM